jgi:hypothetical protein
MDELTDKLYKQFPDVHPNIVLKTEILRVGLKFSKSALDQFKVRDDFHYKGYHLFSYNLDPLSTYNDRIPWTIRLEDGCPIQVRVNSNSRFVVDYVDGKFFIYENGNIISSNISFSSKPKWQDMRLEDGTYLRAVVQGLAEELAFITFNKYCEFWNTHDQCLFCDIVSTLKEQRRKGEDPIARKHPKVVADAVKLCFNLDSRFRLMYLTGGTLLKGYQGESELDFYCNRLEAIKQALQCWYPTSFQIAAQDDEGWKRIRATDVPTVQPNIEVWDKRLFQWICPGKDKFIGYDEWIRRTLRAVDFWGPGRVQPNFVLGVEMAKPYGFSNIGEAVKSIASGWDFLMSHGVLPRYANWVIEPGSVFKDQQLPPLRFFIEAEKAYIECRRKYNFDPPIGALTRKSYSLSCLQDYEYYHGIGPLSRKYHEERIKAGMTESGNEKGNDPQHQNYGCPCSDWEEA